jgi:hypothetical protein
MILGVFAEIERLVEYIPIHNDILPIDGRLMENVSIDTQFYFEDIDGIAVRLGILEVGRNTISLRDIIKLFNKFLKDATVEEIVNKQLYKQLQIINGSGLPLKNLLFDFSLAALEGDSFDAKLYLTNSFFFLGLHRGLTLLLSVIINEPTLKEDKDVRQLLTLIARITEPNNVDVYFDVNGGGFNKRYTIYLQELSKLTPIYNRGISKYKGTTAKTKAL